MNFYRIIGMIFYVILLVVISYSIFFNMNDESIICRYIPWVGIIYLVFFLTTIFISMYHPDDAFEYPND